MRATRELILAARELHRRMTPEEKLLWSRLRRHFLGVQFRRQVPIEPFIVDFVCLQKRLVIEVDGRQHLNNPQDVERDRWLQANRFRVLRFWNDEVTGNISAVLLAISEALDRPPLSY